MLKEDATPWTHRMSSVRLDESAGRGAVAQLEEHCLLSDLSPASRGPQDEDYRFQIQMSRVRVPPALLSVWSPETSCVSSSINRSCALLQGGGRGGRGYPLSRKCVGKKPGEEEGITEGTAARGGNRS